VSLVGGICSLQTMPVSLCCGAQRPSLVPAHPPQRHGSRSFNATLVERRIRTNSVLARRALPLIARWAFSAAMPWCYMLMRDARRARRASANCRAAGGFRVRKATDRSSSSSITSSPSADGNRSTRAKGASRAPATVRLAKRKRSLRRWRNGQSRWYRCVAAVERALASLRGCIGLE